MREYEVMLILPPDAEDAAVDGVVERITGTIAKHGGEVAQVDKWGRRRLAYEIAHHTEGYYVVARFTADPAAIPELDRVLSLADEVVRFKVVLRQAA
jgi:small subunit ribosomal protein S6